ncbi:uncharacterized protein N7483_008658 [Penicillium malachiteum]|uniref:uncharacterized protein n=1 Tax=Penicillium malachiteum TaxID=1324776 RepID=UPI002547138D|nr:uncharacterized protein N7483_008658 [Penicillium malachiteum]KAJ5720724.1 hypothetical protein N7483_008658 [Penicillium malachiteum]
MRQGPGWVTYKDFIIPKLTEQVASLVQSRDTIDVLEIGPGPDTILGYLPISLRQKIRKYTTFEPIIQFATELEESLCSTLEFEKPFPCLDSTPVVCREPFTIKAIHNDDVNNPGLLQSGQKFDLILFCHSLYGTGNNSNLITATLQLLVNSHGGAKVVAFHRQGSSHFDDLVCHKTSLTWDGFVGVFDEDDTLDAFALFISGYGMQGENIDAVLRAEWRNTCRNLGHFDQSKPGLIHFYVPEVMITFKANASTALSELIKKVPLSTNKPTKSPRARRCRPAAILTPKTFEQVQICVKWALKHGLSLNIIGGGHSDHSVWPGVVSLDLAAFNNVHALGHGDRDAGSPYKNYSMVVAQGGSKTGDIVREAMSAGMAVPLGSRPSVGAGLWLQGGLGHMSRDKGLSSDWIIGILMVSVESGEIFHLGHVPEAYRPQFSMRPENHDDIFWAMKGAGSSFGIVLSVTFRASPAPIYRIQRWYVKFEQLDEAKDFDEVAARFQNFLSQTHPKRHSEDAYLYSSLDCLNLAVTRIETTDAGSYFNPIMPGLRPECMVPGAIQSSIEIVDGVGLFEIEKHMAELQNDQAPGKISAFKRCIFLSKEKAFHFARYLIDAFLDRATELSYIHLLHCGGQVCSIPSDITAFGCREWEYACVITGVWPREEDGTYVEQAAKAWVYRTAEGMLPGCHGVYSTDLGPDPLDITLAQKAFGSNMRRLTRLKTTLDPHNVLSCGFTFRPELLRQQTIFMVTGDNFVGKDYCAGVWSSVLKKLSHCSLEVRIVSISEATKQEYAAATGADPFRLNEDRDYKEKHRQALTTFFHNQLQTRPRLHEEHFLKVVNDAQDADVLFITGIREEAPVTAYAHLVPDKKLLDIRVEVSHWTRQTRRGHRESQINEDSQSATPTYCSSMTFRNDRHTDSPIKAFGKYHLFPFVSDGHRSLRNVVYSVPDFPRSGVNFRHVLNINQVAGGISLCASILTLCYPGNWNKVDAIVCCQSGGYLFAPELAADVGIPLVPIREAGKLPPPTISVRKWCSHISSSTSGSPEKRIEIGRGVIARGSYVVVVDDVFASGRTLCDILTLLQKAEISIDDITVMVVAEFPVHRGRQRLRDNGFGRVNVQSLLVFDGE